MKFSACSLCAALLFITLSPLEAGAEGIYRVVDEHGNVTYTDQPPGDGSQPMELPDITIIETAPADSPVQESARSDEPVTPSLAQLKNSYSDFRIAQPLHEETFWGAANEVLVSWVSKEPLLDGMKVLLYVDGVATDVTGTSTRSLSLERGEHTVQVELISGRKRLVTASPVVTFFIKQASLGYHKTRTLPAADSCGVCVYGR